MISKKMLKIMRHFIKWFFIVSGVILWLLFFFSLLLPSSEFESPLNRFLIGPIIMLWIYVALWSEYFAW